LGEPILGSKEENQERNYARNFLGGNIRTIHLGRKGGEGITEEGRNFNRKKKKRIRREIKKKSELK